MAINLVKLITTLFLLLGLNAEAALYYVKSAGGTGLGADDASAWSLAKLNSTALAPGDKVFFKAGDTFFGAPTPRAGVEFDRYGTGAAPVFSGFVSLTSWTNVGTNLWEANLTAGAKETMVTIGGQVHEPGRFPNTGWLNIMSGTYGSLTTSYGSPLTFLGADVVIKKREWMIDRASISSISGSTINYTDTYTSPFPSLSPQSGGYWGFYFTDHNATLDLQNEWAYTPGSPGKLRMYSTVNPASLNVKASTVSTLVNISGLSNMSFKNLTFEGTTAALFTISGGSDNKIQNCTLRFAGTKAIDAQFMTRPIIDGNIVQQTNYSAIDAIIGTKQKIRNNSIDYAGMRTSLCGPNNAANNGMFVNGIGDTIINNTVTNAGYNGIYFSGDSMYVLNNVVDRYCMIAADGGGIYNGSDQTAKGRVVKGNFIFNGLGPRDGTPFPGFDNAMGIYVDEGSQEIDIEDNTCSNNNGAGIYIHIGRKLRIKRNTLINNRRQFYMAEDRIDAVRITDVVFTDNYLFSQNSSQKVYSFIATPSISTFFTSIGNNLIASPTSPSDLIYGMEIYQTGVDGNGDPIYNYDQDTYSLTAWKTAYPGFDVSSTGAPAEFSSGTPVFHYNTTAAPIIISLPGIYKNIKGTTFSSGSLTLQPYTNEILIRTGDLIVTNPTVKFKGRIILQK